MNWGRLRHQCRDKTGLDKVGKSELSANTVAFISYRVRMKALAFHLHPFYLHSDEFFL